ncbi:transcription initiation factor IIF, alpha subunit (TFIIF-alpha) domain-containing protein [Ditylenchus destructor]|nr:transcription initiation factor IIF, alpha subunit (TFIIF-alpha) domain-containing protein [Ditylenchus destructor]
MSDGATSRQNEYAVKIPKVTDMLRYSILKFNGPLNVDPVNWPTKEIAMEREDNKAVVQTGEIKQEFGEGSEYGKAAREEARRKRLGRQARMYAHDNQPWRLTVKDGEAKPRQFRSLREGGAGEHADYWVFLKAGDDFHAHKISNWYNFLPCTQHKVLDSEQAEEKFQQRNKVMNQFALKAQIQQQLKDQEDVGVTSKASTLKIKDDASSDEEDELEDAEDGEASERKPKKPKKKIKNGADEAKRQKKQRVQNADEIAAYESEDGDDEGREYDYMSDSGSDSDRDEKTMEQKVEEALVGVGDETGLKKDMDWDLDTTDEDEKEGDEDNDDEEEAAANKPVRKPKPAANKDSGEPAEDPESSGSDSDDPDSGKVKSVLFMQKKEQQRKRPADDSQPGSQNAVGGASSSAGSDMKRAKVEEKPFEMPSAPLAAHGAAEALDEEIVRRLLQRKPHTTKELLSKVKQRCGNMSKQDIVTKLANILKKIEPYQFKQKVGEKDVTYFSLTKNAL